jgi:hypothetical protein
MAWVRGRLVVATSLRYMLLDPASGGYAQLFALPEEAPPPTLVAAIPGADQAVLLMARPSPGPLSRRTAARIRAARSPGLLYTVMFLGGTLAASVLSRQTLRGAPCPRRQPGLPPCLGAASGALSRCCLPNPNPAPRAQDQVGIVVDAEGRPASSALTFPDAPLALAAAGIYVLAACADGVHVYDRGAAAWVQSLPFPGGLRAAPGQQLCAAQSARGACVLVAGFRRARARPPSLV